MKRALLSLVILMAVGFGYQTVSTKVELRELSPSGRLVEIDGHVMHLHCEGAGSPTVVLEAGATGFAATWARIQPSLAADTRVCSYDRAGMGWSEPIAGPVDGAAAADRLLRLLSTAGEGGPFVLVGHSMGGPIALAVAAQAPESVAGIVMVDPSHPDQLTRFSPEVAKNQEKFVSMVGFASRLAHLGILRATNLIGKNASQLPDTAYRVARFFGSSPTHLSTSHRELLAWDQTMDAARQVKDLGSIPLVVVSADANMAGMPEGFIAINHEMHRELARLSDRGQHEVVAGADHFSIVMHEPHAASTVRHIQVLLEEARAVTVSDLE